MNWVRQLWTKLVELDSLNGKVAYLEFMYIIVVVFVMKVVIFILLLVNNSI